MIPPVNRSVSPPETALWLLLVMCSGVDRWDQKWFLGCVQNSSDTAFLREKQRLWGIWRAATLVNARCVSGMTCSLSKLMWGAHSQFSNSPKGQRKAKSLPSLAYYGPSARVCLVRSQSAGQREGQSPFKTFAGGCSLSLPVVVGKGQRMATYLELLTCLRMPILGLGTWQVPAGPLLIPVPLVTQVTPGSSWESQ